VNKTLLKNFEQLSLVLKISAILLTLVRVLASFVVYHMLGTCLNCNCFKSDFIIVKLTVLLCYSVSIANESEDFYDFLFRDKANKSCYFYT